MNQSYFGCPAEKRFISKLTLDVCPTFSNQSAISHHKAHTCPAATSDVTKQSGCVNVEHAAFVCKYLNFSKHLVL